MLALSSEQEALVSAVGEFASAEFAQDAYSWEGTIPWENLQGLADHGFLGVNFDKQYGGGGLSEFEALLVGEAVGRVCPDTGGLLLNQQLIAPRVIHTFGTDHAKEEYLPPVLAGEDLVAVAISEPQAGSDVGAMKTKVTERDGDLFLSGEKTWVSYLPDASAAVVWAKFPEGLGSIILDLDAQGVDIAQHHTNMMGNTQTQFYMEDVKIPDENVLVRGKEAFKRQLAELNWERMSIAASANTIAVNALEMALEYAEDREQFDQPIEEFQGIEWKLATMIKQVETSRAMTYQTVETAGGEEGVPDRLHSQIAKLFASEVVHDVVDEALQIHGANGYQQGHPLEYLYRWVRAFRIGGGTDEILKNTIASHLKVDGVPGIL
jgi:alkylation response protein AidB-like acyl-CoA dehydrogenase